MPREIYVTTATERAVIRLAQKAHRQWQRQWPVVRLGLFVIACVGSVAAVTGLGVLLLEDVQEQQAKAERARQDAVICPPGEPDRNWTPRLDTKGKIAPEDYERWVCRLRDWRNDWRSLR